MRRLALLAVLLVAGCASPFDDAPYRTFLDRDPEQWQLSEPGVTHSRSAWRSRMADAGGAASGDDAAIPADASIDDYVRLALERHPSIRAAERHIERLAARVPQVTALDDPMFQVAPVGEMAQTAAGEVGLMTSVSQKLPFPGKLDTRGRIAQQDVAMAGATLERVRLEVEARTRRAYWSLYAAVRDIEVTQASRALLAQFKEVAEAKYRAGDAQQQDVLRASVELHNLDKDLHTLRQSRAAAEAMLNRLLDRPVIAPLPDPAPASPEHVTHNLDRFLAVAARTNPDLARMRQQIEQDRQRMKLARINRLPDLTVALSYNAVEDEGIAMSANGRDQWWLSFGINLPIWQGKRDAAEREAHQGLLASLAQLQAEHNRVDFEVREAFDRMRTHHHHVLLLRDSIVPEAKQAVQATIGRYRAGDVDFLVVIDNWRRMLQFERMLYDHQAMLEQAAADLRQATGRAESARSDESMLERHDEH